MKNRAVGERAVAVAGVSLALLATISFSRSARAGPTVSDVTQARGSVIPPRLIGSASVAYPASATGDGIVVLMVTVNADGTVRTARALEGTEPFSGAAVAASPSWRFEPATRDGFPVASVIRFEVSFHAPTSVPAPEATPATSSSPAASGTAEKSPPSESEVVVRGQRAAPMVTSFTRAEVRQLPGAFGDPFRAIEALPGVTPILTGLPFFYVRGAPPGNVGYFLDGVRVPYLFHVGLGPSVIHPGMVDHVDLYPGGYPARFGRFAGGIVSGETTAPRDDFHGEGNIRIFDAGALAETGFDGGRGTVLVGGRYSYTAAILSLATQKIALDYRDYQARVTYDVTPHDRLTAFTFGSYDLLGQVQDGLLNVAFGSEFYRLDLRYEHTFGRGSSLRTDVTLGFDQTEITDQRNAIDRMVLPRVELYHPISANVVFRAGLDSTYDAFGANPELYADPDDPNTKRFNAAFPPRDDLSVAGWSDVVLDVTPRIQVTPGIRVDVYDSGGVTDVGVDPRVSARLKVTKGFRFVEAYGLAHQTPSFVLPIPGLIPGKFTGGLQKAVQASAGVEIDLPEATTATATVFHNEFYDMTDALSTAPALSQGSVFRSLTQRTNGSAVGFELYVRRSLTKKLGGFVSYTLSRSLRNLGNETFPSAFDRTHVANAVLAYDLGRRWRAGTRLVFYTGVPKNGTTSGLVAPPPSLTPARDPAFFRIDFRLEKRWLIGQRGWISFVVEMLNATLSKETIDTQTIGPIFLPSVGVEAGF